MMFFVATSCLSVALSPVVFAEQVEGLYDVSIAVESQSTKHRTSVTRQALEIVFIRVSGNSQIVEEPAIRTAVRNASIYTKQFSYQSKSDGVDEQLYVELEFESTLVDKTLRDAGLPFWSANRPTVLLWLVIEDINGRRFINADDDPDIFDAISFHATRRGLTFRLPALDLEDTIAVSPDDIWQLDSRKARTAAQRYRADTLLFGRVTKLTNGTWLGRWLFNNSVDEIEFDDDAETTDQYIGSSFDVIADDLARQYAIAPVDIADNGVIMRLVGVNQFVKYARAIRYLESVAAIRHANVIKIKGDEIIIRLVADGSLSQLEQVLALDKKLQPIEKNDHQNPNSIDLNFRWPSI
jgi:hypothetical protein